MNRERAHFTALVAVTGITAYFSYAYFHIDEYFQILELVRYKNGDIGDPLPWEHVERLRPWLQPALYFGVVKVLGLHDAYRMAFVLRLLTGLANVGSVFLLWRTTERWLETDEAKRLHLRVLTLLGFLPYLFVRTSSESASAAALTAGFALIFRSTRKREGKWEGEPSLVQMALGGFLLGAAFEFRFQTAFSSLPIVIWLLVHRVRRIALLAGGGFAALLLGALADRWGYGEWQFPAWTYFRTNILEGAAGTFGTEPPFAYVWMTPANLFFPVVGALIVLVVLAWRRHLRDPLTAATLPFVLVHCLIAHKEERFLFPVVTLCVALVAFAGVRIRAFRFFAAWSFAGMALLACFAVGWHTHVRFERGVHDHVGDELHAIATPEIDLNLPPFRPRVYDVQKAPAAEIARRVETNAAPDWLIMDRPDLDDAPELKGHARLVFSELPFFEDAAMRSREMRWVDWYNAHASLPLRHVHYRSLYRLER